MCNGSSQRTTQGGSIAVLHPPRHVPTTQSQQSPAVRRLRKEMILLFSNPLSKKAGTNIEVQGFNDDDDVDDSHTRQKGEEAENEKCWLVIYRDGDLSTTSSFSPSTSSSLQPHTNAMFTFPLDTTALLAATADKGRKVVQLPQKLHLGVGDQGIVGRRVSFVAMPSSCSFESLAGMEGGRGMRTLAEGIVGWN